VRGGTPGLISGDLIDILDGHTSARSLYEVYGYQPGMGLPSAEDRAEILRLMADRATRGGSAPPSHSAPAR
jgi:hypothetical protein